MIGTTIVHYRIEAKLGEGGMGEVYRARDSKLNRDVALKILPQLFAQDSQRMAREKDPDYARAHVGGALVWIGRRQIGVTPPREANTRIKADLQRALELDDSLVEAHYALAVNQTWGEWNWEAAERAFERTIAYAVSSTVC